MRPCSMLVTAETLGHLLIHSCLDHRLRQRCEQPTRPGQRDAAIASPTHQRPGNLPLMPRERGRTVRGLPRWRRTHAHPRLGRHGTLPVTHPPGMLGHLQRAAGSPPTGAIGEVVNALVSGMVSAIPTALCTPGRREKGAHVVAHPMTATGRPHPEGGSSAGTGTARCEILSRFRTFRDMACLAGRLSELQRVASGRVTLRPPRRVAEPSARWPRGLSHLPGRCLVLQELVSRRHMLTEVSTEDLVDRFTPPPHPSRRSGRTGWCRCCR